MAKDYFNPTTKTHIPDFWIDQIDSCTTVQELGIVLKKVLRLIPIE